MLSEPKIEHRNQRYYLSISRTIPIGQISQVLPPLIPQVHQWMNDRKIKASGPDFFLYKSINANHELECEAGLPIDLLMAGDGPIEGDSLIGLGSFPEGRYASLIYTGDFKDMLQGHMALERWIKEKGLKEKIETVQGVTKWGARTEFYLVDPELEADPSKWQTEIAFLLED
jgi:effector-binding domain-containing protein